MSIAILTPSRGRPAWLAEMVESIRSTAYTDVTVVIGLDEDDADNYPRIKGVEYVIRPRMQLGAWTNVLAEMTWGDFDVLGSLGDDHRCRTPGWDAAVLDAVAERDALLAYGRDGLQDEKLPTAPFWRSDVIRALGWYFPPPLTHLYADDFWLRLGQQTSVAYLSHVLIEHMHPAAGKAEMDDSYRESNSREMDAADHAAFNEYMATAFAGDLERVRAACGF